MSANLKKELTEALNALEGKKAVDKERVSLKLKGANNRTIRTKYATKGWCYEGDHPIIDLEGGE